MATVYLAEDLEHEHKVALEAEISSTRCPRFAATRPSTGIASRAASGGAQP